MSPDRATNPTEEPKYGRRAVLLAGALGAITGGAAILGGQEAVEYFFPDGETKRDNFHKKHDDDVLIDPDKYTMFIGEYLPLAEQLATEDTAIPFEVYLSISMHESDSGESELAQNANNMFGVIAKDGWAGEIYLKPTEEEVPADSLPALQAQYGDKLEVVQDYGDGRIRVKHPRQFRKYEKPEDSFKDFTNKLYFKNQDGTYRYADVVEYLQGGGQDPYRVIDLMSDNDQPGELQYATGREWHDAVYNYIGLIQNTTGKKSAESKDKEPKEKLPEPSEGIDVSLIDFGELKEERDKALIDTMKEALEGLTLSEYVAFQKSGIKPMWQRVLEITNNDTEFYKKFFDSRTVDPQFIVWHLWANGVQNSGDANTVPTGTSHKGTLSNQILSWYNNRTARPSSAAYMMSDNPEGDLWQLVKNPFGRTLHAGSGIQDEGATSHPGVGNSNSIGIEVQANSIYDVSSQQFKLLTYFTTQKLFEMGKLKAGMTREQSDKAIEASVVGHGKNNGLEFGVKYASPLIQALQQFAFIAIQAR